MDKTKLDPKEIGDIVVGTVLGIGTTRALESRAAAFMAGVPDTVPIHVVNRLCSSGLQAVASIAASIKAGYYDVGLAVGVEHMTAMAFQQGFSTNPRVFMNQQAKDCMMPMGITSENVAKQFNISRKEQDELAVRSHARAAHAIKTGRFKDEIVPMRTKIKDKKTGALKEIILDTDGGVRAGTKVEGLSKLKAAFQKGGSTTAGNASQISDGAAAVLVMKRSKAQELGMPIIANFKSFHVAGVAPNIMGIGPAAAIPGAVERAGLNMKDIDLWEINEAFASQAAYCVKKLGLSWDNVNVNGGAVALGHPLGATGARMTATLLHEMHKRPNDKFGVVSMCIGSGMGAAAVYEKE